MSTFTWKKALAVTLSVLTCAVCLMTQPTEPNFPIETEAATIAELEARKQENNRKIQDYENKLAQFSESQKQETEYQATLQKKIDAIQGNMQIMDTELEGVKEQIYYLDYDIQNLEQEISQQEQKIQEGLEMFKLRIRAMYINGNESVISVLAGATDFYDLLSKYELISCVAKHDDELVTNLKEELESYHENLDTLEIQKNELEQIKTEKEAMQKEMQASMSELRFAYADSQAEQQRLALEQEFANQSIKNLKADNSLADSAEAELQEQIRQEQEKQKKHTEVVIMTAPVHTTVPVQTTEKVFVKKTAETTVAEKEFVSAPETMPEVARTAPVTQATTQATTKATTQTTTKATTKATTQTTTVTTQPAIAPTEPATVLAVPDYDSTSFSWPCPGYYYISSGFGSRWGTTHKGIDIAQNAGADVVASRAGKVIKAYTGCTHNYGKSSNCCGNGYGNYVLIDHEDGTYSTMYAHMQSVVVSVGDYVEKGQKVGVVGTTGWSTGYHLHFEIRKDGTPVNPDDYLNY